MTRRAKKPLRRASAASRNASNEILAVIGRIPRGSVLSYGEVARLAGLPGRARLVGTTLKQLPARTRVPWQRVVNASGRIAFPENSAAYLEQKSRLEAEGVTLRGRLIDLRRYGWHAPEESLDELLWKRRVARGVMKT